MFYVFLELRKFSSFTFRKARWWLKKKKIAKERLCRLSYGRKEFDGENDGENLFNIVSDESALKARDRHTGKALSKVFFSLLTLLMLSATFPLSSCKIFGRKLATPQLFIFMKSIKKTATHSLALPGRWALSVVNIDEASWVIGLCVRDIQDHFFHDNKNDSRGLESDFNPNTNSIFMFNIFFMQTSCT